jgi:ribosome-associated protein
VKKKIDMSDIQEIVLNSEPTELYKILKFEGLVASGGEAKAVIADGHVLLNGQVETRKRCKIHGGDIIEFASQQYLLKFA